MAEPTITVHTTPSQEIVKAANAVETITVGERTFGLKKPGILAQYKIVEILGDTAKNEVYMGMVNPVLWVVEVDGQPQPEPSTKRELYALIQLLGEEGVIAIGEHLAKKVGPAQGVDNLKN